MKIQQEQPYNRMQPDFGELMRGVMCNTEVS